MTRRSDPDVASLLPLTPVVFEILLALGGGEQHGYAIMQDVAERTGGRIELHAGTLYRALSRLLDGGFIEELSNRPGGDNDDQRRRYYRLTPLGTAVARAEAERLDAQLSVARERRLLRRHP